MFTAFQRQAFGLTIRTLKTEYMIKSKYQTNIVIH